MAALREITQELALAVDMTGAPAPGYTEKEIEDLEYRLLYEFGQTALGQELVARGGKDIAQRIWNIYTERNSCRPYCVTDAFGDLESVGKDLLVDLPDLPAPKPTPQPVRTLTPQEEHEAAVQRVRDEMADPKVAAASIMERRRVDPVYKELFREASQLEEQRNDPPVADGKVVQFAHMYNEAVQTHGMDSVRPRMGVVTLKLGSGKQYVYPHAEFTNLLEAAAQSNLI